MNLFVSADIEGSCGICKWDETLKGNQANEMFSNQMSKEVAAICEAAIESQKISQILIRDAHGGADNLNPNLLPEGIKLIRGWKGEPGGMMTGLTRGCDIIAMTGYHSGAYSQGSPLAHTTNCENQYVKINGMFASEFLINSYLAAYYEVPVIFLSGDRKICEEAKSICPNITTVEVSEGYGGSSISIHPVTALKRMKEGMERALDQDPKKCLITLPNKFHVEIEYKELIRAEKSSFYPGAVRNGAKSTCFDTIDYYEVIRFLFFNL